MPTKFIVVCCSGLAVWSGGGDEDFVVVKVVLVVVLGIVVLVVVLGIVVVVDVVVNHGEALVGFILGVAGCPW